MVVDADGRIAFANAAAERLIGEDFAFATGTCVPHQRNISRLSTA
jgi:hypothetical protein